MTRQDIQKIKDERLLWLKWKNIIPMREALDNIKKIDTTNLSISYDDWVTIGTKDDITQDQKDMLIVNLKKMIPWRKGPFQLCDVQIDSEWQSNLKYNLLEKHFDLKDKVVADVGCNNGYYMFRMLEQNPKKIIGFDPSAIFKTQFDTINHFVKSNIEYELLGVEHLEFYNHKFDMIFMLGVLYHRSDPIASLKSLARSLNPDGEVIVDSFIIDGDQDIALCPASRYAMIPNVYFIPTVKCFINWLNRAGFKDIQLIEITTTDNKEQRVTPWTFGQSLGNFLDPNDHTKTTEGYPAPKRAYLKAKKK
jgi:tRNA (mo5U34)-methyltransferase